MLGSTEFLSVMKPVGAQCSTPVPLNKCTGFFRALIRHAGWVMRNLWFCPTIDCGLTQVKLIDIRLTSEWVEKPTVCFTVSEPVAVSWECSSFPFPTLQIIFMHQMLAMFTLYKLHLKLRDPNPKHVSHSDISFIFLSSPVFFSEITIFIIFRKGAVTRGGLPSMEADKWLGDSSPQPSCLNATTLSAWPWPVIGHHRGRQTRQHWVFYRTKKIRVVGSVQTVDSEFAAISQASLFICAPCINTPKGEVCFGLPLRWIAKWWTDWNWKIKTPEWNSQSFIAQALFE